MSTALDEEFGVGAQGGVEVENLGSSIGGESADHIGCRTGGVVQVTHLAGGIPTGDHLETREQRTPSTGLIAIIRHEELDPFWVFPARLPSAKVTPFTVALP